MDSGANLSNAVLRYPDFLCIGAMKAGTSWLDRNLRRHPDIWLPPLKELHYFDSLHVQKAGASAGELSAKDRKHIQRALDKSSRLAGKRPRSAEQATRDAETLACLAIIAEQERNDGWYGRIFQMSPRSSICGEITPHYALLPPAGIEHIVRLQPGIKIVYILRDPIERAWSQLRMRDDEKKKGTIGRSDNKTDAVAMLRAHGDYIQVVKRFEERVGAGRMLVTYFDDLCERPERLLRDLCQFLEVDFARGNFERMEKTVYQGTQRSMDNETYGELRTLMEPVYLQLLALNNPIADRWRRKHYCGG